MLAPPERRARDRLRKAKQRKRRNAGLCRCQLWLTERALEGLTRQLTITGRLTNKQAADHAKLEAAIAALLEQQGLSWR
jgi:hypothetical protein